MPLVTVTYNAWDHNREVVPAELRPRVGFRPVATSLEAGLMTDREIWGGLNTTTGAGSVELESIPGLFYVPFMEWLTDASQWSEAVQNRAMGRSEWKPIHPANGGSISNLPGVVKLSGVWYGFGSPPSFLRERDDSIYLDITGPGVGVWGPERAALSEGVQV